MSGEGVVVGGAAVLATGPHTCTITTVMITKITKITMITMITKITHRLALVGAQLLDVVPVEAAGAEALNGPEVYAGVVAATRAGVRETAVCAGNQMGQMVQP